MSPVQKLKAHVFICTNERTAENPKGCCKSKGSEELLALFKEEAAKKGLHHQIRVQKAGCLDACEYGPSIVVYPENIWYAQVQPQDIAEIIQSHLIEGTPVNRLKMPDK